jgi:hypothetical protein
MVGKRFYSRRQDPPKTVQGPANGPGRSPGYDALEDRPCRNIRQSQKPSTTIALMAGRNGSTRPITRTSLTCPVFLLGMAYAFARKVHAPANPWGAGATTRMDAAFAASLPQL